MKIRHQHKADKIELQMTPMIDIVFQLLVFFIMTFKVVEMEGDFNIKMPLSTTQGAVVDLVPPMQVRLRADTSGNLTSCSLNQDSVPLGSRDETRFMALREKIAGIIGDERGPGSVQESAEVELDCDYNLHYKYVIEAITAVSGEVDPATGDIIKLVEKIKFAPPRTGAGG